MRFTYNGFTYEGDHEAIVSRVLEFMDGTAMKIEFSSDSHIIHYSLGEETIKTSELEDMASSGFTLEREVRKRLVDRALAKIPEAPMVVRPDLDLIQVVLFTDGIYKEEVDF